MQCALGSRGQSFRALHPIAWCVCRMWWRVRGCRWRVASENGGWGAHVPQLSTGLVGVAGRRPVHQHCSIFHSTCSSGGGRIPLLDGWRLL